MEKFIKDWSVLNSMSKNDINLFPQMLLENIRQNYGVPPLIIIKELVELDDFKEGYALMLQEYEMFKVDFKADYVVGFSQQKNNKHFSSIPLIHCGRFDKNERNYLDYELENFENTHFDHFDRALFYPDELVSKDYLEKLLYGVKINNEIIAIPWFPVSYVDLRKKHPELALEVKEGIAKIYEDKHKY